MRNILVLGAAGQIGSELVPYLRNIYSADSVVATDINNKVPASLKDAGPFVVLDALNGADMLATVKKIQYRYHLQPGGRAFCQR
jgi:nucleoside-diphosphate-sugar epimerase